MNHPEPGEEGSMQGGQIKTPMCETNVTGSGNSAPTHSYKDMPSPSGGDGNASIIGPGDQYQKG